MIHATSEKTKKKKDKTNRKCIFVFGGAIGCIGHSLMKNSIRKADFVFFLFFRLPPPFRCVCAHVVCVCVCVLVPASWVGGCSGGDVEQSRRGNEKKSDSGLLNCRTYVILFKAICSILSEMTVGWQSSGDRVIMIVPLVETVAFEGMRRTA